MKKKKVILSSIAATVMCASLVTGATYALFTSESQTNVAITSGTVDVKATLAVAELYSPKGIGTDGVITDETDLAGETFANGGTVKVDGEEITVTNMVPGDKAIFEVTITNNTNVAFLQRITLTPTNEDEGLFSQLLVGISDSVDGEYTYYSDYATAWEEGTPITDGVATTETMYVSVEMPGYVTNKWHGKQCGLAFSVNAVQGNAAVTEQENIKPLKVVNAEEFKSAVESAVDGEAIYLNEPISGAVTIESNESKSVTIKGYKIQDLTVNMPNGTLHVYNNVGSLTGQYVAMHSLYVYGEIDSLFVKSGRVVVENDADVDVISIAPESTDTKVEVAIHQTTVETESIVLEENVTETNAVLTVYNDTIDEIESVLVKNEKEITIQPADDYCAVENEEKNEKIIYIGSLDGLKQFRDEVNAGNSYAGWTVKLTNDIDLNNEEWTPIGNRWTTVANDSTNTPFSGSFDGQGHIISNLYIKEKVQNLSLISNRKGLFGTIKPVGATYFKNMTLHNADVTAGYHVGAIIATVEGSSQSATGNYLVITDLNLTGLVKVYGYEGVGGVNGSGNIAEISNITVDVEEGSYVTTMPDGRTNSFACVGSVKGGGYLAKVDNITSNMDVTAKTAGTGGLFGVIGGQTVKCYVSNLSYSGKVTLTESSVDQTRGYSNYQYNGLLIGSARFSLIADEATCSSTGTLELHTEEDIMTSNDMGEAFTWGEDLFGASRDYTYTNKSYSTVYAG